MSWGRRFSPSLPALVYTAAAVLIALCASGGFFRSGGDLPRHLRQGLFMLETGHLLHDYPFSYTVPAGKPFLGFEYGSQLVLAAVYRCAGLAGVAIFTATAIATALALVTRFLLRRGTDPLLAVAVSLAAAALTAIHWAARPHLFTFIGIALLLPVLEYQRAPRPWLVAAGFAVWANLHGGFLFGFLLLAAYATGEWLESHASPGEAPLWRARARAHVICLAAGAVGALATPFGVTLYGHLIAFFGSSYLADHTDEFLSPDFHTTAAKPFLLVILGISAALALSPRRPEWPRFLALLGTVAAGLVSLRNMPFVGLAGLPLIVLALDRAWRTLPLVVRMRAFVAHVFDGGRTGVYVGVTTALLLLLALNRGRAGGQQLVTDRFNPATYPVEAVARARAARLDGRLFNEFPWGGFVLYAWPEQRVFIDGGTDFFGSDFMRTYVEVLSLERGWRDTLLGWSVSLALLKPDGRLADALLREPGWELWYCDRTAAVLQRTGSGADGAGSVRASALLDRCAGRDTTETSTIKVSPLNAMAAQESGVTTGATRRTVVPAPTRTASRPSSENVSSRIPPLAAR